LNIHSKLRHVKVLQTVYKCALIIEVAVSILIGNLKPELVTGISNTVSNVIRNIVRVKAADEASNESENVVGALLIA
jgi:hypothetical protein